MEQYLIDNNIISGYFSGIYSNEAMRFVSRIIDNTPVVSVITQIEALSWITNDKSKEEIVKSFISDSHIISLNQEIVEECIKIRRSRKIRTPDAIIAATAIVNNLLLLSTDNGLKNIPDLKIVNPKEIV